MPAMTRVIGIDPGLCRIHAGLRLVHGLLRLCDRSLVVVDPLRGLIDALLQRVREGGVFGDIRFQDVEHLPIHCDLVLVPFDGMREVGHMLRVGLICGLVPREGRLQRRHHLLLPVQGFVGLPRDVVQVLSCAERHVSEDRSLRVSHRADHLVGPLDLQRLVQHCLIVRHHLRVPALHRLRPAQIDLIGTEREGVCVQIVLRYRHLELGGIEQRLRVMQVLALRVERLGICRQRGLGACERRLRVGEMMGGVAERALVRRLVLLRLGQRGRRRRLRGLIGGEMRLRGMQRVGR